MMLAHFSASFRYIIWCFTIPEELSKEAMHHWSACCCMELKLIWEDGKGALSSETYQIYLIATGPHWTSDSQGKLCHHVSAKKTIWMISKFQNIRRKTEPHKDRPSTQHQHAHHNVSGRFPDAQITTKRPDTSITTIVNLADKRTSRRAEAIT